MKYISIVNIGIISSLTLIVLFISLKSSSNPDMTRLKIESGAFVADVRTVEEFNLSHYPGAINIPLDDLEKRIDEFGEKNNPIVVYCRSGNRSSTAQKILKSRGYTDVINGGGLKQMLKLVK